MQLAANWPDKSKGLVSPLIDLDPHTTGRQGGSEKHRERLSEETFQLGWVNKRSDSPNPGRLILAVDLWNKGFIWSEISKKTGIPERTARRYLSRMGFKRTQKFVGSKISGIPKSREHRNKISTVRIEKGVARREKNPNWKGGIKNSKIPIWNTTEYKIWRKSIFERDNYTCKGCGKHGGYLEAHHILPRRDFSHLTFDLSNGITLCKSCHDKTRKKEYLSINIWRQRVDSKKNV